MEKAGRALMVPFHSPFWLSGPTPQIISQGETGVPLRTAQGKGRPLTALGKKKYRDEGPGKVPLPGPLQRLSGTQGDFPRLVRWLLREASVTDTEGKAQASPEGEALRFGHQAAMLTRVAKTTGQGQGGTGSVWSFRPLLWRGTTNSKRPGPSGWLVSGEEGWGEPAALSHHVHKELAGVAHGHVEGLAAGGELGGH